MFFRFDGLSSSFSPLSGSSSSGKSSFKSSSGDCLAPLGENCFLAIDLDGEVAYCSFIVRSSMSMSDPSDTA